MQNLLEKGKVNIGFIDGQWGSSGKGKFNGSLALTDLLDFAISQNSVNASHIFRWDDGHEYKFQHLPTSVVNPNVKCIIGAGASIDLPQLLKEMGDWNMVPGHCFIHPNAVVITPEDIEYEKEHLLRIASTMTGNGAAAARKIMRAPGVKTAADCPELKPFIADTYRLMQNWLRDGRTGILETAQGFDLSIDHGMIFSHRGLGDSRTDVHRAYPYTTSRNVDPMTFAGMTGLNRGYMGKVFLNLRTLPIRVGDGSNNTMDGLHKDLDLSTSNSGAFYPDQSEMSWADVTAFAGSDVPITEMTSLTKRKRRVFSFSFMQLEHITSIIQPDYISLNFANYFDARLLGSRGVMSLREFNDLSPKVASLIREIEQHQAYAGTSMAAKVVLIGTGPAHSDYIRLV